MSLTRRCINPVSPGWARYFLVATRKYPKKRSPWRCAPNTGVPSLRCLAQQVLRGHIHDARGRTREILLAPLRAELRLRTMLGLL